MGDAPRVKWVHQHALGCHALEAVADGRWANPWYFPGQIVLRDAAGRRHAHGAHEWLVVGCNSTNCAAEVLVHAEDLLDVVVEVALD